MTSRNWQPRIFPPKRDITDAGEIPDESGKLFGILNNNNNNREKKPKKQSGRLGKSQGTLLGEKVRKAGFSGVKGRW